MTESHSPEAFRLGRCLDAHHPATGDDPATATCDRCGFLMYTPRAEGFKHLPAESEFFRVKKWLSDFSGRRVQTPPYDYP